MDKNKIVSPRRQKYSTIDHQNRLWWHTSSPACCDDFRAPIIKSCGSLIVWPTIPNQGVMNSNQGSHLYDFCFKFTLSFSVKESMDNLIMCVKFQMRTGPVWKIQTTPTHCDRRPVYITIRPLVKFCVFIHQFNLLQLWQLRWPHSLGCRYWMRKSRVRFSVGQIWEMYLSKLVLRWVFGDSISECIPLLWYSQHTSLRPGNYCYWTITKLFTR